MMKLNLKWAAMAAAVFVMTAAASASAIVMLPGRSGDQPILHEKSFKACVLKGREKVDFARDFWNDKIVAEVQHVVGKPDSWYLHVQDMRRDNRKNHFVTVALQSEKISYEFPEDARVINAAVPEGEEGMDIWYRVPEEFIAKIAADPKGWKLTAVKENGKTFNHSFNTLAEQIGKMQGAFDVEALYGPMYSVFFEGKTLEEVRRAFVYYLNADTDPDKPYLYMTTRDVQMVEFYQVGGGPCGYASFHEMPSGTWLDLDFWESFNETEYCRVTMPGSLDNESVVHGFRTVQQAYYALEDHTDYGIVLQNSDKITIPKVESVDAEAHSELAVVAKDDVILSINDVDVSKKNYQAQYALDFARLDETLWIRLRNKEKGEYLIAAHPVTAAQQDPDALTYGKFTMEEDPYFTEQRPRQISGRVPTYEIFDPLGDPSPHIMAPAWMHLARAIGRI